MAQATVTNIGSRYAADPQPRKCWATLRAAAILTTSYVDTDHIDLSNFVAAGLFFDITQGSLTSLEYRVWQSLDGVTWFQEANETIAASVVTDTAHYYTIALSADVKYYKIVGLMGKFVKIDVKGTGTLTGSSLAVYATGVY